jgi:hypothetical protein
LHWHQQLLKCTGAWSLPPSWTNRSHVMAAVLCCEIPVSGHCHLLVSRSDCHMMLIEYNPADQSTLTEHALRRSLMLQETAAMLILLSCRRTQTCTPLPRNHIISVQSVSTSIKNFNADAARSSAGSLIQIHGTRK